MPFIDLIYIKNIQKYTLYKDLIQREKKKGRQKKRKGVGVDVSQSRTSQIRLKAACCRLGKMLTIQSATINYMYMLCILSAYSAWLTIANNVAAVKTETL